MAPEAVRGAAKMSGVRARGTKETAAKASDSAAQTESAGPAANGVQGAKSAQRPRDPLEGIVPRRSRAQKYALAAGIASMVWSLLINAVRLGLLPPQLALFADVFPLWCVVCLGALGLGSVGWHLLVLEECTDAAEELVRDVAAARADLSKRGFNFDAGRVAAK